MRPQSFDCGWVCMRTSPARPCARFNEAAVFRLRMGIRRDMTIRIKNRFNEAAVFRLRMAARVWRAAAWRRVLQ